MKRILLLFVITIILATASLVSADTPTPQKIRIAAFNFYPTLFQAKDGSVQGFYVDFLSEIAKREGWTIEYVYGNWADGLSRIKSGEVDVLTNVALTAERTQFMDYGKVPLLTVWAELYAPNGSPIDSIRDVQNKKIALMKGDFNAANFKNLVEKFGIPCTYVEYGNFEEVFKAISARQVDAGIVNNTFGTAKQSEYALKSTGVIFNPFDIFFTVAKGKNSAILATLDHYLEDWRKTESSPYHQARERWSHKSASTIRVAHPWLKKAAVISGVLLCIAVGFVILLRIQVRRKTMEIQKYTDELHLAARQLEDELAERQAAQEALQEQTAILEEEIAERNQIEETLRESEVQYRNLADAGLALIWRSGTDKLCYYFNKTWLDFTGRTLEQETGNGWAEGVYPEDFDQCLKTYVTAFDKREKFEMEYRLRHVSGEYRWIFDMGTPNYNVDNEFVGYIGHCFDITERKRIKENLSQSRQLLVNLANLVPGVIYQYRLYPDGRSAFPYASQGMNLIYEVTPEEVQEDATPVFGRLHPDDYENVASAIQESARTLQTFYCEFRVILPQQGLRWRWSQAQPERMPDGGTLWHGIISDITERKQTEIELAQSQLLLKSSIESQKDTILLAVDNNYQYLFFNRTHSDVMKHAYNTDVAVGMNILECITSDDDRKAAKENYGRALKGESHSNVRIFGEVVPAYYESYFNPVLNDKNEIIGATALARDITERIQAEQEKIKLEHQLLQAQKMESVGRLAGGVAHDFNNLLTVILGGAHLALSELEPGQPLHEYVTQIQKAGEKSADLTQQLLAFARKQTIEPKVLDLNDTVSGMLKMLQRLIGENTQLTWQPANNLWQVKADPSQIDQILANLCVNARDSIADIGTITIQTGNSVIDEGYNAEHADVIPGEYVHISVSDSGCGMDKETMAHIFEPFFTTKGIGEGTGLGLATVYGAAKQNNGFVNVYSELGIGTTFTIYLPRYVGNTEQKSAKDQAQPSPRGLETILLVEDEAAILNMVKMLLGKQGYTVLAANTPKEAVKLASEQTGEIDLLITDVIMPEMNGKDLAHNLMSQYPKLKCLFMSGYTADAISQHGVLDEGTHFIHKPFSLPDLAVKVRKVLDGN